MRRSKALSNCIFLDCAFPTRRDSDGGDEEDDTQPYGHGDGMPYGPPYFGQLPGPRSLVTLSGLLNAIDGVGSEDGRLFFATVRFKSFVNIFTMLKWLII